MTTQQAYDQMREFFSREGAVLSQEPSQEENIFEATCFYRHPDNEAVRCAAGCLIPDDLYDAEFEQVSIKSLFVRSEALAKLFSDTSVDFLEQAQMAHDRAVDVPGFIANLDELASLRFGLKVRP